MEFCFRCGFDMDMDQHEDDMQDICNTCMQEEYEAAMEARAEDRYWDSVAQAEQDAENAWLRYAESGWGISGEYLYDSLVIR